MPKLFKKKKKEELLDTGSPERDPIAEAPGFPPDPPPLFLPLGKDEVAKANHILNKYKQGKANLDRRIIESEEWWKLRQWSTTHRDSGTRTDPMYAGSQLWNCITSKHADAMDSYPEPNVRPRMPDDRDEAKRLTSVLPVILERNDFLKVYSDHWWSLLKKGTGIYGCFWDGSALGGLGDIAVRHIDLLSISWQPGITDIQDSANVFYETLVPNERLKERWPQLEGKLGGKPSAVRHYRYDDEVDTSDCSVLVDWYYKKWNGVRRVVHLAQFVGDELLFATENDPAAYPNGIYDHGMYPFIVHALFPVEGSIAGHGYYDVAKQYQEQIDVLNQAIVKNAAFGAKPRFFIREDGSVSEAEFADPERDLVHVGGNLGEDSIRQIHVSPFSEAALRLLNSKIDEMKEVTGNRDVTNGGIGGGVTAASAIAALQEAVFTARPFDAQRAKTTGLVQQIAPVDKFEKALEETIELFLANSQVAQQEAKSLFATLTTPTLEEVDRAWEKHWRSWNSPAGKEGVLAFLEKRG